MKKLMIAIALIFSLSLTIASHINDEVDSAMPSGLESPNTMLPPSVIDDIEVPYRVLNEVQMKYQGKAVTQARKVMRDEKWMYSLRIDNDDRPYDYESIFLLYDMKWKLVGTEKMYAPPPEPAKDETDKEEKPDKPVEQKPDPIDEDDIDDEDDEPEESGGGRGGPGRDNPGNPDTPPLVGQPS